MADTRCYKNSTVSGEWSLKDISENNSVCPGTQQEDGFSRCCGKSDICLPHNICQALNAGPGESGFHVGSCTDRDYESPACTNFCSDVRNPDIVYNATTGKWHCCGIDADGKPKCDNPTKRTSQAPAPTVLLQDYSASVSTFTASSTSSSTSTSASPTGTSSPDEGSSGLSTGAKAGAGVGGAIGGLLVIALIIFLVKWKRKPGSTQHSQPQQQDGHEYYDLAKQNPPERQPSQPPSYQSPAKSYVPPAELSPQNSSQMRSELPTSGSHRPQSPQELPP